MSRGIGAATQTWAADRYVKAAIFVEAEFAAGTVRACNAAKSVDWNGYTWTGAGQVGKIEPIVDSLSNEVSGVALELSHVPAGMLATALDPTNYFNRRCTIWFAPLTDAEVVDVSRPPFMLFRGRMDTMPIAIGDEFGVIRLTVESLDIDWNRGRETRYTDAEQQYRATGDRFFKWVNAIQSRPIAWGRPIDQG